MQSYIPISTVYFSLSGAWFLSTLVLSYLLFPYIIKFIQKFSIKISFLFLLLIPLGMLFYQGGNEVYWFYINPVVRFFDFFLGVLLAEVYRKIRIKENMTTKKATFLELLIVLFSVVLYIISLKYEIIFNYSIFYWIQSSCLILILSINKGLISKLFCNNWLVYGGRLSFAFFLFHPLLIHFIGLEGRYNIILIVIASFILSHLTIKYFDPFWVNRK